MTDKIPFDVKLWETGNYDAVGYSGEIARSIVIHKIPCEYPVCAIFGKENETFTLEGKYIVDSLDGIHDSDLFLIPKKRKVWLGVRKEKMTNDNYYMTTYAYDNRDDLPIDYLCSRYQFVEIELSSDDGIIV